MTVTCALLLGFLEAPFVHVHECGDDEDHHASEQVHVHASITASPVDGPAFQQLDPADGERAVNWFQAVQHAELFLYVTPEQVSLPEPAEQGEFLQPPPPVRSHDPPSHSQGPSRAPPSIPV